MGSPRNQHSSAQSTTRTNHLSSRRGTSTLQPGRSSWCSLRRQSPRSLFRTLVGTIIFYYFLSSAFLFPSMDVVDSAMTLRSMTSPHANTPHNNKADKHSPAMLLREREIARRNARKKELEDFQKQQSLQVESEKDDDQDDGNDEDPSLDEEEDDDDDETVKDDDDTLKAQTLALDDKTARDQRKQVASDNTNDGGNALDDEFDSPKLVSEQVSNEVVRRNEERQRLRDMALKRRAERLKRNREAQEANDAVAPPKTRREELEEDLIQRRQPHRETEKEMLDRKERQARRTDFEGVDSRDGRDPVQENETTTNKRPRKLPVVAKNVREAPVEGDPLRAETWEFERAALPIKPQVDYLGTLIDAGRHYFPIEWLKGAIDRLSDMNYNLIHLRLTDDQTFNVLLKSHPELAYPTAVDNEEHRVYTVNELRELTAYAKKRGIQIMPEVNVPGHAGAWAGIPDMIVHCPRFICEKGYGLPLNVTHHRIRPILTDIIKEIVDIFDDPPFLHLGGDEVNMAGPCFREVGAKIFDYPAFEEALKEIIKDSGYPEDRVVRWEMTGQKNLNRAGAIEHFWESRPGERHEAEGKYFISQGLYFDTNQEQNAYEVAEAANRHLKADKVPTAIIAGTFELSVQFWYDRNILGRLLSLAIGASSLNLNHGPGGAREKVISQWEDYCELLGFGEIICETQGRPIIPTRVYHSKWRKKWDEWKRDICERTTEMAEVREFKRNVRTAPGFLNSGDKFFWREFPVEARVFEEGEKPDSTLPADLEGLLKHTVPHTGVILDAVSAMPTTRRLDSIIHQYVSIMGFNLVQLRLVSNAGFVFDTESLGYSLISDESNPLYDLNGDLLKLVKSAKDIGIDMMPEISISTNAGGWINSRLLADCPNFFCSGKGTPLNINDRTVFPSLFMIISKLRMVFSSRYFHLGTDDRDASKPCFAEARESPDFSMFERKIEALLTLADIASNEIIRTENTERVRYTDRAGNITQYPSGTWEADLIANRQDHSFFLTVDIFKGDAYSIFESAKKAVGLKPLGIMAEIRKLNDSKWKAWKIPERLLAFAMGVSEVANFWSIYDAATFATYFTQICQALNLDSDCEPPGEFQKTMNIITDSEEFIQKTCETGTTTNTKRVAKSVVPYYGDHHQLGAGASGAATSTA